MNRFRILISVATCLLVTSFAQTVDAQQAESSNLMRLAPEKCWAYSAWQTHQPDPGSSNPAEQLIAEPEIQTFLKDLKTSVKRLGKALLAEAPDESRDIAETLLPKVIELAFESSGCMFVEDLTLRDNDPPEISGAVFVESKTKPANLLKQILDLHAASGESAKPIDIQGEAFYSITVNKEPQTELLLGAVNKFFVAGMGEKSVGSAIERMKGDSIPAWLTALDARNQLDKRKTLSYLNVKTLMNTFLPMAGADAEKIVQSIGLQNLEAIESVSGYSSDATVSRYSLRFAGQMSGAFDLFGNEAITTKQLDKIPADSLFAFGLSLDPKKVLNFADRATDEAPPSRELDQLKNGIEQAQQVLDINFRKDLLPHLGSIFTVSNGAADGWLTGTTFSMSANDPDRLKLAIEDMFRKLSNQNGIPVRPQAKTIEKNGYEFQSLLVPGIPIPFSPSWGLTDDRMVGAFYSSSIPTAMGQIEFEKLIDTETYKNSVAGESDSGDLVALAWIDAQTQFEFMYPYAQLFFGFAQFALSQSGAPSEAVQAVGDVTNTLELPPARIIHQHLRPSITTLRRQEDSLHFEIQQTLPMVDATVLAPLAVGMLLPAVQAVRAAARRTQSANNLRQHALASLNYESAFRYYPPAWTENDNSEPLLSWRVLILPYIEQGNLYDQFKLDEPWDSEHNIKLLDKMPEVFRSPNSTLAEPGMTVYRSVGGERGVIQPPKNKNKGRSIGTVVDGTSNTILFIETTDALAVPWTKPDTGINPDKLNPVELLNMHTGGTNAAFADGSVQFIYNGVDLEKLKFLMIADDGQYVDPDDATNRDR